MPGAAGTETWRFEVVSAGTTKVELSYSRPWETAPPISTFELTVTVEPTPAPVASKTVTVGCEAIGGTPLTRSVDAVVGDIVELTLCSNPTTGYSWSDPVIDPSNGLKLLDHQARALTSPVPGAAGTEIWRFEVVSAGTTKAALSYSRPWENIPPMSTFELTVNAVPAK